MDASFVNRSANEVTWRTWNTLNTTATQYWPGNEVVVQFYDPNHPEFGCIQSKKFKVGESVRFSGTVPHIDIGKEGDDMGTRHLTIVYLDGEYKVAQYGQWDGYPEGQGKTVLQFAREISEPCARKTFAEKVRSCSYFTKKELDEIDKAIKNNEIKNWQRLFPQLSRDTGAEILTFINNEPAGMKLQSDLEFAADSLFCEWAWLIDLDAGKLEAYKGFNEKPLTENDRFYFLRDKEPEYHTDTYHAVVLAASWSLDDLPSDESFLAAFGEDE